METRGGDSTSWRMLLKENKLATSPGVYCMVPVPTSSKQRKESTDIELERNQQNVLKIEIFDAKRSFQQDN